MSDDFQSYVVSGIVNFIEFSEQFKWFTETDVFKNKYGKGLVTLLCMLSYRICFRVVLNNLTLIRNSIMDKKDMIQIMHELMKSYINDNIELPNKYLNVLRKMLKSGILAIVGSLVYLSVNSFKMYSEKWWRKQVRRYYYDWMTHPIEGTFDRMYSHGLFKSINSFLVKKKHNDRNFFESVNINCFRNLISITTILFRGFLNVNIVKEKNDKEGRSNCNTMCGHLHSVVQPFVSWDPPSEHYNNSRQCREHLGLMFLREVSGCVERTLNAPN